MVIIIIITINDVLKKSWHSQDFHLPCITIKENFIISPIFIFKIAFYVSQLSKLYTFLFILYNF